MILRTKTRRLEIGERNKLKANKTFGLYVFNDEEAFHNEFRAFS